MNRKKRLLKVSAILHGGLFGMAAVNLFGAGTIVFGLVNLVASAANFSQLKRPDSKYLSAGIFLLNALTAAITAYSYQSNGSQSIHYVWWMVVVLSIGAMIVILRKSGRKQIE